MAESPSVSNLYVDEILTNIGIQYSQAASDYVAGRVFPLVPVELESGLIKTIPQGNLLLDEFKPRALGERPERVSGVTLTDQAYHCIEEALMDFIDDRQRRNNRTPFPLDRTTTNKLTRKLLIRRDLRWATEFFITGIWTTELQGVAASPGAGEFLQWDQAAADIVQQMTNYKRTFHAATGYMPNVAVLGPDVFDVTINDADIIDRVKYTQRGVITRELLSSLFGLEVVVPQSRYNTAEEGQTPSYSYINGTKDMLLAYAAMAPSVDEPSAGYTLVFNALYGDDAFGGHVKRGRDDLAESDLIGVYSSYDQLRTAQDLGMFFDDVVA